jgi:hypothetical protein
VASSLVAGKVHGSSSEFLHVPVCVVSRSFASLPMGTAEK